MARVDTIRFEASHGRTPKGSGWWMFETQDRRVVTEVRGTYTEAKRAALRYAAERGIAVLYVCP